MILIAGDSWAAGEWTSNLTSLVSQLRWDKLITHEGLCKFLKDDGHQVLNLAQPGFGNLGNFKSVLNYLMCNPEQQVEKIFIFQTDWCRDVYHHSTLGVETRSIGHWLYQPTVDLSACNQALYYRDAVLSTFYQQLSNLGQTFNIDIFIIGGLSDVIAYDRFSLEYPRVTCVCRSAVSLAVHDDADVEPLTTGFLTPQFGMLADFIKRQLNPEQIDILIDQISLGAQRQMLFKNRLDLFPDGWHGGRLLHQKVYKLLKTKNIV